MLIATELPWQESIAALDDGDVKLCLTDLPYPTTERHRRVGTTTRTKKSSASSNSWFGVLSIEELCLFLEALFPKMAKDTYAFVYVDRDTELLLQAELGVAAKLREITDRLTSDPLAPGFTGAIKDRIGWGWRNSSDWLTPGAEKNEWKSDPDFVSWLHEREYEGCSAGAILYMYEAWCGSRSMPAEDEVVRWVKTTIDGERLRPGTGYHGVRCTEQLLCLTKGKPKPRKGQRWPNAMFAARPTLRDADGQAVREGTPKPISIARRLIRAGTQKGDLVYDPFVGSGNHAIATHQEGRFGYFNDLNLGLFRLNLNVVSVPYQEAPS